MVFYVLRHKCRDHHCKHTQHLYSLLFPYLGKRKCHLSMLMLKAFFPSIDFEQSTLALPCVSSIVHGDQYISIYTCCVQTSKDPAARAADSVGSGGWR